MKAISPNEGDFGRNTLHAMRRVPRHVNVLHLVKERDWGGAGRDRAFGK